MTLNRITKFAIAYHRRNWPVVSVPYRKKGPTTKGWKQRRLTEPEIIEQFNGAPTNIGVMMGEPSGIVDIDLDCPESRRLAAGMLPPTDMRFGRNGSPNSHWIYAAEVNGQRTSMFKGPDGGSLVELRSNGSQTLFPPSIHPNGDEIGFESKDDPAHVDLPKLLEAVHELAGGCLLLRHYPGPGSRHDYALAIAGGLLRAGWPVDRVQQYIEVIAVAAGDDEVEDRILAVGTTKAARNDGRETTGWPRVHEIIDGSEPKQQYVARIRRHLGIDRKPEPTAIEVVRPVAIETTITGPYESHRASMDAVNAMAATGRHILDLSDDLAVQISIWLDRKGPELLDKDFPIPYCASAIGISRGHFHKLGQIGRVVRVSRACDTPLPRSDRAILPLARLLPEHPEAIAEAVNDAREMTKAEARENHYDKPKPINKRHTTAAVNRIVGEPPVQTPVRRKSALGPHSAACDDIRKLIVDLADAIDGIPTVPNDVRALIVKLTKHGWCRP